MRRFLIFVLLVVLILLGLYLNERRQPRRAPEKFTPAASPVIDVKDVQVLAAIDKEYTTIVEKVVPSVVSVATSRTVRVPMADPFDMLFGRRPRAREYVQNALGSGVIVSKEGHILSNNHVVANMQEIKVQLSDGRIEPAEIIGTDEQTDIAVLKIRASNITPLPIGDSDEVKVGQLVFAVGNPFGLQETVTRGIISAKGRRSSEDSANEYFQTDAAINPGNSGGPLINLRGEIIGINSSIYSGSGGWQGIGFAIPSNVARRVMDGVLRTGQPVHGYLGVTIQPITADLARQFSLSDTKGALLAEVAPGSPAEKAGLKTGDVVRKFNGQAIRGVQDFQKRIASAEVGAKVQLAIVREGKDLSLTAEIAERPPPGSAGETPATPNAPPGLQPPVPAPGAGQALAGVGVAEIPPSTRPSLPDNVHGVIVTQVDPGSPAAGVLQPGDAIEEINRQPINSVSDFQRIAKTLRPGERLVLYIARGKTRSFVVLQT
jgi:serine protease Do